MSFRRSAALALFQRGLVGEIILGALDESPEPNRDLAALLECPVYRALRSFNGDRDGDP